MTLYNKNNSDKLAIVVHVFYYEVWSKIKEKLISVNSYEFDLYVTGSEKICKDIKNSLGDNFRKVFFLSVENQGMDVLPFIKAVEYYNLCEYGMVLKLHTKNEKSLERKKQGEMIVSSLLNEDVLSRLLSKKDKDTAIFPGFFTRSINKLMYDNQKNIDELLDDISLSTQGNYFSAGTMFWMAGTCLRPIVENYTYIVDKFKNESSKYTTGSDGLLAHAFERFFGILVNDDSLELSLKKI